MAKKGLPQWEDETYYEIKLIRPTMYPPETGKMIPVGAQITMKGKAAKLIEQDIADAVAKPK